MNRPIKILGLRTAIVVLAPGAWCFWTFAVWRSRLQIRLENLKAADGQ